MNLGMPRDYEFYVATCVMLRSLARFGIDADLYLVVIASVDIVGILLETDPNQIAEKVASHSMDSGAPLSEQTITQALATAREHLARSLLK